MKDEKALRDQWNELLAAHRALASAYVQALGADCAPSIAQKVRATIIHVNALSELLGLPLEREPG